MLSLLSHRPVAELLINLVSFEEVNAGSPTVRWKFVQALSTFKLYTRLCEIVSGSKNDFCDATSGAAADVIIELTGKLCLDDNGEILFSPFGYVPELIDGLVTAATSTELSLVRRTDCVRVLLEILQKSTPEEIQLPIQQQQYMYMEPKITMVTNKLHR